MILKFKKFLFLNLNSLFYQKLDDQLEFDIEWAIKKRLDYAT